MIEKILKTNRYSLRVLTFALSTLTASWLHAGAVNLIKEEEFMKMLKTDQENYVTGLPLKQREELFHKLGQKGKAAIFKYLPYTTRLDCWDELDRVGKVMNTRRVHEGKRETFWKNLNNPWRIRLWNNLDNDGKIFNFRYFIRYLSPGECKAFWKGLNDSQCAMWWGKLRELEQDQNVPYLDRHFSYLSQKMQEKCWSDLSETSREDIFPWMPLAWRDANFKKLNAWRRAKNFPYLSFDKCVSLWKTFNQAEKNRTFPYTPRKMRKIWWNDLDQKGKDCNICHIAAGRRVEHFNELSTDGMIKNLTFIPEKECEQYLSHPSIDQCTHLWNSLKTNQKSILFQYFPRILREKLYSELSQKGKITNAAHLKKSRRLGQRESSM